jgi:glutamate/tyrosine decarboxylase-like PLP-dependent enzyme
MRQAMMIQELQGRFKALQQEICHGPIVPQVTVEEIRDYLSSRYRFGEAMDLEDVIADVERMLQHWQVQVTHPRYFGLFNPSVTLASVVADTLVAMYNPQLANWRTAPAANEMERHTLGWLAGKFGISKDGIANFTSGGMEANYSAVVCGLTHKFKDYGEHGVRALSGMPTIYLTHEAHHGYIKIAHVAGIGRCAVRIVETDQHLKMNVDDLAKQVVADRMKGLCPFMVVGTAGTTGTGVIDPLSEIADYCRDQELWFHVDAAWGGAAVLSPALKPYLAGIEFADSITCDAHKWFSVPMGAGMFFCQHAETVCRAFRTDVTYMAGKEDSSVFNPLASSMQWSRRFIGLKLFMSLAQFGESGYRKMIEHQTAMGHLLRQSLLKSGWLLVNDTPLPLVCFTRQGLNVRLFLQHLQNDQIAWMSPVTVNGQEVVRACVTSFNTSEMDVIEVVNEMNRFADYRSCSHSNTGMA